MSIIKGGIPENLRIRPGIEDGPRIKKEEASKSGAVPFSELLEGQLRTPPKTESGDGLKFSAHAQARLQSRGIDLSPDELVKLQEAVHRAREKGSRESLILTDKAAFIVSVKNQTVITAVDRENMKENVFTNIDSTVMI
jgi:flagellar operon protein